MAIERHVDLPYAETFRSALSRLPGRGIAWLDRLREDAIEQFRASGLPTQRVEEWKYTSLNALIKTDYVTARGDAAAPEPALLAGLLPDESEARRLVFVNGFYRPELSAPGSLPAGVRVAPLSEALAGDTSAIENRIARIAAPNGHAMVNINTAFMADGVVIELPDDATVERPIHLVFAGARETDAGGAPAPVAFHPRIVVAAGANSRATVLESHVGAAGESYWSNPVVEVDLAPGAQLSHCKLQAEAPEAVHLAVTKVRLDEMAVYDNMVLHTGAALARNEIHAVIDGEGAECRLNGGYLGTTGQHIDNTTLIEHVKPHGTSVETYKGVLDGKGRAVFQGKIAVHPHAQKTDARMLSKTLLLSSRAEIDTKPELEIYADDVKCAHGATAGDIDEDALFYLRARGVGIEEARALLVDAFLRSIVDEAACEPVRERLGALVSGWLQAR